MTLIGFSLGARAIFYCLRALAEHPRGAGIVENAYLLGAPVSGKPAEWKMFSKVIAGKVVNAYIRYWRNSLKVCLLLIFYGRMCVQFLKKLRFFSFEQLTSSYYSHENLKPQHHRETSQRNLKNLIEAST